MRRYLAIPAHQGWSPIWATTNRLFLTWIGNPFLESLNRISESGKPHRHLQFFFEGLSLLFLFLLVSLVSSEAVISRAPPATDLARNQIEICGEEHFSVSFQFCSIPLSQELRWLILKMGQPRPVFNLFLSFSYEFNCQQDSNSDCQSRRRERRPPSRPIFVG